MRTRFGVAVVVLVLSACGSSKGSSPGASRSTTTTTTSTSTTTSSACSFTGSTDRTEEPSTVPEMFLLTDVTVAPQECTDTVTFTFTASPGGSPKFVIEPASPPFAQSGSGEAFTVPGTAFLRVRFQPAWIADPKTGGVTYAGPHRIEPTGTVVTRGVVLYDAFEGVVGWIVGLDGTGRYKVTSSDSPPSVTITVGR